MKNKINIRPEYSAQPTNALANPMAVKAISYLKKNYFKDTDLKSLRVADQGCGKLRHLKILLRYFNIIYLVDTKLQLHRIQRLAGELNTIPEYISNLNILGTHISIIDNENFINSMFNLDIIFNLCNFDVNLTKARNEMLKSAYKNLNNLRYFVLVIPRNDYSITKRCNNANKYQDGYIFKNRDAYTFYRNYKDLNALKNQLKRSNFQLLEDMSIYRQVCLILQKR